MRRIVHDAYAREENYLRTDGHDVCHWCFPATADVNLGTVRDAYVLVLRRAARGG